MPARGRLRRALGLPVSRALWLPVSRALGLPARTASRCARIGEPGSNLAGTAPGGAAVSVEVTDLTLYFLTASCYGCRAVWERLRQGKHLSVVVVTPSRETESARAVGELAPPGVTVVMSSEGWHDYDVHKAPWQVVVKDGVILADGPL